MKKSTSHSAAGRAPLAQTVMIALFAALSYLSLLIFRIPYPAPVGQPFLHFGNAVVILASLLLGGWQGGLAGSIGMGFYDLSFGYGLASLKTVVLKFGIGLFAGLVARQGRRHPDRNPRVGLWIASTGSLLVGVTLLAGSLSGVSSFSGVAPLTYIFLLCLGAGLLSVTALSTRCAGLTNEVLFAILGATAGIAWNVVGEFAGGTLMKLFAGAEWQAAMLASLMSLPATFINGAFSIAAAVLLYLPVRTALRRAHLDGILAH